MLTDKQLKAVAMPGDFIFHSSWFEIFKSFDMATTYAIFMAMIAYVQTGEIPADEELRRLTVFLFAHIDTDRQRILSLQPKRRTTAKKKTDPETPAPTEPEPKSNTEHPDDTAKPQPADAAVPQPSTDLSDASVISDISVISKTSPVLSAPQDAARRAHYAMRLALASAKAKHSKKSQKGGKRR